MTDPKEPTIPRQCVCTLIRIKGAPSPRCTNAVPDTGWYATGDYCIDCLKGHHTHAREPRS